ncbi:hypothetical protein MJH12_04835 [bacterium]|nr:hypothetical protein [bacterium]
MTNKENHISIGQILAIINALFGVFLSWTIFKNERIELVQYILLIFIPFFVISILFWANYYIPAFIVLSLFFTFSSGCTLVFDENARHSTTRNNLAAIRSAINVYQSNNNKFPSPTISGATNSSQSGHNSLEAILSNQRDMGDGQEYIGGAIPPELISDKHGNNFVCIVADGVEYYSDQSNYNKCQNNYPDDKPNQLNGGFVYFSEKGLIRPNFQVFGPDLRERKQHNIGALFQDWKEWLSQHEDLKDDYPVRW